MMAVDARTNLADDLLLYTDKLSMAHSLEVRVPMLDQELALWVESLPLQLRTGLRETTVCAPGACVQDPGTQHREAPEEELPDTVRRLVPNDVERLDRGATPGLGCPLSRAH